MNQTTIREYSHHDSSRVKQFYTAIENEKKNDRVFSTLKNKKGVRQSWQMGMVSLCVIHLLKRTTWRMALLEVFLWTTSLSLVWYKWISQEYDNHLKERTEVLMDMLDGLEKEEKSNAWIMENKEGKLVGTAVLKYQDNREGKLGYLTGTNIEITHELVRIAMTFAKSNKIEVISKCLDNNL
ncbi:unnamed protein product [Rhizopus stolonifer]